MTLPICPAVTKSGKPCTYRGRHDGYCKFHVPKKLGDCPICYEEITTETSKITRCKHAFHKTCLERWMEENPTCPLCRADIRPTTGQLRPRTNQEETLSSFLQSAWPRENATFVTSIGDLEHLGIDLATIRNAPIEIRFNGSYWGEQ